MKTFVNAVVSQMEIADEGNRVGVVTYGNRAEVAIPFGAYQDKTSLMAAVDALKWKDERTNTSGAIKVHGFCLHF